MGNDYIPVDHLKPGMRVIYRRMRQRPGGGIEGKDLPATIIRISQKGGWRWATIQVDGESRKTHIKAGGLRYLEE